jgi:putative membrane protein
MSKKKKEHGPLRHAADKAQDVVGGMVGRMSASTVSSADEFVEKAATGDMYEIEAARIALRRSGSAEIRSVAAQMIDDHTAGVHHMQAALEMNETRGVRALPKDLDTRHRKLVEHLETAPDDKFDAAYVDQQILAHEETATLLEGYGDEGDNPQLRSLATSMLPVVKRHLLQAKELRKSMAH